MAQARELTLEQMQTLAAAVGVTVGDELAMFVPLMNQILAQLDAVPDAVLREVEPLPTHDARRWGPR